ncbi:PIH1 domain-containing protein 2 isoform X2 [Arapaima gigas]
MGKHRFTACFHLQPNQMAIQDPEANLQKVEQLWSMLDEMSESDPEGYRTFIQHQLKEGTDFYSPPQPKYCLQTRILEPEEGWLYINVCGWKWVPPPQSLSHPIPLFGGRLETATEGQDTYHVLDVAFSPEVLCEALVDGENGQLSLLALRYAEQQHSLCLSQHYTLASSSLKGSLKSLQHRLTFTQQPADPERSVPHGDPTRHSLLQQISAHQGGHTEKGNGFVVTLTPQQQDRGQQKRPALIEVISSTETVRLRQPNHKLTVVAGVDGAAGHVHLTVYLPGVHSVSECQLHISQDDVLVEVEDLYHLHLDLPVMVKEEEASAIFKRRKQTLFVSVPVL